MIEKLRRHIADVQRPEITRRQALFVGALGAAYLGLQHILHPHHIPPSPTLGTPIPPKQPTPTSSPTRFEAKPTASPTEVSLEAFQAPFDDKDANEIAKKRGITVGSFFEVDTALYDKMNHFRDLKVDLLPLYPPSVYRHKDLIYQMAEKHNVSPNLIALIMTLESWGIPGSNNDLGTYGKAEGLMGVMNYHFKSVGITDEETMRDPAINTNRGMQIFKDFLNKSQKVNGDKGATRTYLRALMGYNRGLPGLTASFENRNPNSELDLTDQTRWYHDNAYRYILFMEIAQELRNKGFSDAQIIKKLESKELSRRIQVQEEYRAKLVSEDRYTFPRYEETMQVLSKPVVDPRTEIGQRYYRAKSQEPDKRPTSFRLHLAIQGSQNIDIGGDTYNLTFTDWNNLDTKRSIIKYKKPDNSIIFDQKDPQWDIAEEWDSGSTCGPTTIAMVLRRFGDATADPAKIDSIFIAKSLRIDMNGEPSKYGDTLFRTPDPTMYDVETWLKKEKNYEVIPVMDKNALVNAPKIMDYTKAKELLSQGYLIISSGRATWLHEESGDQTPIDHIFLVEDVNAKRGEILVADPFHAKVKPRKFTDANMFYMYAVRPKQ